MRVVKCLLLKSHSRQKFIYFRVLNYNIHFKFHHYQALDDLQQFLHHHSYPLVSKKTADCLKMRGAHKVAVGAINVAVCNVQWLGKNERKPVNSILICSKSTWISDNLYSHSYISQCIPSRKSQWICQRHRALGFSGICLFLIQNLQATIPHWHDCYRVRNTAVTALSLIKSFLSKFQYMDFRIPLLFFYLMTSFTDWLSWTLKWDYTK